MKDYFNDDSLLLTIIHLHFLPSSKCCFNLAVPNFSLSMLGI